MSQSSETNTNDTPLSLENNTLWRLIHTHFNENPQYLVSHHIESYNDFFKKDIFDIFRDQNPITIVSAYDETIKDYKHKCLLYLGGKDGTRLYFGKPVIHDKDRTHYMYPNEARLRNMTYAMTIHYDVEVEFIDILSPGEAPYIIGPEFLGGNALNSLDDNEHDYDYDKEFAEDDAERKSNTNY